MNELSLFTGAGGGILGTRLLGFRHVGYVEWDEYCQKIIAQRIEDGHAEKAPIFTDVRKFVQSGAAREYRGFADLVSAGFPCQPFSIAGKQNAENDERNMWPATIDVIRAVKPDFCLLENVPGLLSAGKGALEDGSERPLCGYFGTILRDLSESGYDAKWITLGADDVGAFHRRKRLWIVAHSKIK